MPSQVEGMKLKRKFWMLFLLPLMVCGCASIPPEAVVLSHRIGMDLQGLHKAHRNMVQLYYARMRSDVTSLVDEVYAPSVVRFVLEEQVEEYEAGRSSLYGFIESFKDGNAEKEGCLKEVLEFLEDANQQINAQRDALLTPLLEEEQKALMDVDNAYENIIKANHTIENYLESLRKINESQRQVMSLIGMEGVEDKLNGRALEISEYVENALREGKKIDLTQTDGIQKVGSVMDGIQKIINKK